MELTLCSNNEKRNVEGVGERRKEEKRVGKWRNVLELVGSKIISFEILLTVENASNDG